MNNENVECCANCKHCLVYPKNNRYGDIDYLCVATTYFVYGIHKDRTKVRHYTSGGRELECKYERNDKK